MHKCARCGREIQKLEEVSSGCPCGSKTFVFDREVAAKVAEAAATPPLEIPSGKNSEAPLHVIAPSEVLMEKAGAEAAQIAPSVSFAEKKAEADGKAPNSYFARATFTSEDVENIKIVTEGVFLVDVNALSKNPVVLKDDDGVYFVKIPFGAEEEISKPVIDKPNGGKEKKD